MDAIQLFFLKKKKKKKKKNLKHTHTHTHIIGLAQVCSMLLVNGNRNIQF